SEPISSCCSKTMTSRPVLARACATARPTTPAPTTMISTSALIVTFGTEAALGSPLTADDRLQQPVMPQHCATRAKILIGRRALARVSTICAGRGKEIGSHLPLDYGAQPDGKQIRTLHEQRAYARLPASGRDRLSLHRGGPQPHATPSLQRDIDGSSSTVQ